MASRGYAGTIPVIAQAYQNDPRTKLAANALMQGTSTQPVAGGGWAWADGLARMGQAVTGALMNKSQDKKFSEREKEYMAAMQLAAQQAGQPATPLPVNPAQANPAAANPSGYDAAAQALAPTQQPQPNPMQGRVDVPQPGAVQSFDPGASAPAMAAQGGQGTMPQAGPQPMPQGLPNPLQRPSVASQSPFPMVEGPAPMPDPTRGGTGPNRGAPQVDARSLYFTGIVPIEGGTDPKSGAFRTSPKGAIGPGQVMPGTAPEAARMAYEMGLIRSPKLNDGLYRTDAGYNNALGQAYYANMLKRFGNDPIKAAAAYNAGPGSARKGTGVNGAIAKAARNGGDWKDYLPGETKQYIVNFANKVGAGGDVGAGGVAATADVPQMQMEQVPDAIAAPPSAKPGAPDLPPEIQSNRIAMAQQMLASGNPDLVTIAQSYLDKGLDEQNSARTLRSQQQFTQGQTGYQTDLQDWSGARSDARQDAYGNRRDAIGRNFQRETQNNQNQYQSGERSLDRAYGTSEREASQGFQAGEADKNRAYGTSEREATQTWQGQQNDLNRDSREDIAAMRRNNFLSSPQGAKLQKEYGEQMAANDKIIGQYSEFMALNQEQPTGGALLNWGSGVIGPYNERLKKMEQIINSTTLLDSSSLKGAVSDKDIAFLKGGNVGLGTPGPANADIARGKIAALRRSNDYLINFLTAQAEGRGTQFLKDWRAFVEAAPIVQRGKVPTDRPITFEQWQKRPKFNAQGQRIN